MNKIGLTIAMTFFLASIFNVATFAQTSKFTGIWEYVKPYENGLYPFVTVIRTVDENGKYTQVRITDKASFIWQIAKLEIVDDHSLRENIEYCINPELTGKTLTIEYKFSEDAKTMTIIGGSWKEDWKKLELPVPAKN